jgi:hypothetical protein
MGFFDGLFEPQQFEIGGGLAGRLEALQREQAGYQPAWHRSRPRSALSQSSHKRLFKHLPSHRCSIRAATSGFRRRVLPKCRRGALQSATTLCRNSGRRRSSPTSAIASAPGSEAGLIPHSAIPSQRCRTRSRDSTPANLPLRQQSSRRRTRRSGGTTLRARLLWRRHRCLYGRAFVDLLVATSCRDRSVAENANEGERHP